MSWQQRHRVGKSINRSLLEQEPCQSLSSLTWTLQEKAKARRHRKGSQLAHLEWHLGVERGGRGGGEPEL